MFRYYLRLAGLSIARNPVLSLLMVAAIGLGIGAFMSVMTINHMMARNPIPEKSDQLFYVQLDNWDPNEAYDAPNEPPDQVTYIDAMALMAAGRASRQTASASFSSAVDPEDPDQAPFAVAVRGTHADFFPMFDVPFLHGSGWDAAADRQHEAVVVLSREVSERLYGDRNPVGEAMRLAGILYRVVGVLDDWQPQPRFYDVSSGAFNNTDDLFLPFNAAIANAIPRGGNSNCWKLPEEKGFKGYMNSECIWIQFWAELPSRQQQEDYRYFLDTYVSEQKALGRFPRALNNRISDVMSWMQNRDVVDPNARAMLALAFMFLVVCLLNTLGLLLAKFLSRAPEIGLRRAVGGSRAQLFTQYLVESAVIGVAGGSLGLLLSWLSLQGMIRLFGDFFRDMAQMDWAMVMMTFLVAVLVSIVAGLYPTWRACSVAPAGQLKGQ